jgi:hypothetical protein
MKLRDIFNPSKVTDGLKYEIYAIDPDYSELAQFEYGPMITEGDWAGYLIGVKHQGNVDSIGNPYSFLGYVSELPEWAEKAPPNIRQTITHITDASNRPS